MKKDGMKVCICDIDGVLANNIERMKRAVYGKGDHEDFFSAMFHAELETPGTGPSVREGMNTFLESLFWASVFNPTQVEYDTVIPGAAEALAQIEENEYVLIFLTSRPESMRQATNEWLWRNFPDLATKDPLDIFDTWFDRLVMKPASQTKVLTTTWKAGFVEMLTRLLAIEDLLVIDDSSNIQKAINDLPLFPIRVRIFSSLASYRIHTQENKTMDQTS